MTMIHVWKLLFLADYATHLICKFSLYLDPLTVLKTSSIKLTTKWLSVKWPYDKNSLLMSHINKYMIWIQLHLDHLIVKHVQHQIGNKVAHFTPSVSNDHDKKKYLLSLSHNPVERKQDVNVTISITWDLYTCPTSNWPHKVGPCRIKWPWYDYKNIFMIPDWYCQGLQMDDEFGHI